MKKANNRQMADDLGPEYDLSKLKGGVRRLRLRIGDNCDVGSAQRGRAMNRKNDFLVLLDADHADDDCSGHVDRLLNFLSSYPKGEECTIVRWSSAS